MTFTGTAEASIDRKGRVVLPTCYRAKMGGAVYLMPADRECIVAYPVETWANLLPKDRAQAEWWCARSYRSEVQERTYRVQVPYPLREHARLWGPDTAVWRGIGHALVLMSREAWEAHERRQAWSLVLVAR